jgi:hypothetical protein
MSLSRMAASTQHGSVSSNRPGQIYPFSMPQRTPAFCPAQRRSPTPQAQRSDSRLQHEPAAAEQAWPDCGLMITIYFMQIDGQPDSPVPRGRAFERI